MGYAVKELFYSIQGEGANSGRAAVFLRFSGCNLWSGRPGDRGKGGSCSAWCDTDFLGTDGPGGGNYGSASELVRAVAGLNPAGRLGFRPLCVCTGGEPALQLDRALVLELRAAGFEVAVETNGTRRLPDEVLWVTVSPKAGAELAVRRGDELKLVYPQAGLDPERFRELDFRHFFLQPMDGPDRESNALAAAEYCLSHPWWRLSLQAQKVLSIP